jgi:hypothetical protein
LLFFTRATGHTIPPWINQTWNSRIIETSCTRCMGITVIEIGALLPERSITGI